MYRLQRNLTNTCSSRIYHTKYFIGTISQKRLTNNHGYIYSLYTSSSFFSTTQTSSLPTLPPRLLATIESIVLSTVRAQLHPITNIPIAASNIPHFIRGVVIEPTFSSSSTSTTSVNSSVDTNKHNNTQTHTPPFTIYCDIEIFSFAAQHWKKFAEKTRQEILNAIYTNLSGVKEGTRAPALLFDVQVRFVRKTHNRTSMKNISTGLAHVGSIIAVSSGKGGVGKSTIAVNLAYALSILGARVGLLDGDIHGPSLPLMVSPSDLTVRKEKDNGCINPLTYEHVQVMSYGWVSPRNKQGERTGGNTLRGPLTASIFTQLLKYTMWNEIDHLIIDLPPGTGDIHVTLGQTVPIAAAVIVTTPQRLALADVARGLDMFTALRVPSTSLLLNMAHFTCPDTQKRYYPFGGSGQDTNGKALRDMMKKYTIPSLYEMPMDANLSSSGDTGHPYVLQYPDTSVTKTFLTLASDVAEAVERNVFTSEIVTHLEIDNNSIPLTNKLLDENNTNKTIVTSFPVFTGQLTNPDSIVSVRYNKDKNSFLVRKISNNAAEELSIPSRNVRLACRCAACIDEMSGKQRLQPENIPDTIYPTNMIAQGNYAIALVWSDTHDTGIFTFEQWIELANFS